MAFLNSIMNATLTLKGIFAYLKGLVDTTLANAEVANTLATVKNLLTPVWAYRFFAFMALALIVAFFGKRLLGILKFLGGFAAGFIAGVALIAPMVSFIPTNFAWIIGLVVGLVAALLNKILYVLIAIVGVGYSAYFCAFTAAILPEVFNFTKGNLLFSGIVAGVAVLLVLIFRKTVERLATAILGGYWFALALANVYNICTISFLATMGNIPHLVVAGIIALIGFIIQVKTRKRY